MSNKLNSKSQVTIFIIIAIILIGGIVTYLIFKNNVNSDNISSNLQPVYDKFLFCLEETAISGVDILESQGGYIYVDELKFESGSSHMPFSSQLNFLGNPIPYWYYISGNNIEKEQVPTKSKMEEELAKFIDSKIKNCKFDKYYEQGFEIQGNEPKTIVKINDDNIEITLDMPLSIQKEKESVQINTHSLKVKTNLGNLYNNAKLVYNYEQSNLFLENYGIDILRLYAPVDGAEVSCSPQIWEGNKIFEELKNAIESNTISLRGKDNEYVLTDKDNKYFVIDLPTKNVDVRFLNSKNWTYSFEVNPSEESLLLANPVGNQPGMGILGFCYVPYHFVYNLKYPVLVQVSKNNEIFQFPMAVVIQGNNPRKSLDSSASEFQSSELCNYKNTDIQVSVYDTNLNSIDADIYYECAGTKCFIGKTKNGKLDEKFPQCGNGILVAQSKDFAETREILSTINSISSEIIMDKKYKLNVNLILDGSKSNDNAVISFNSEKNSKTILYPEQKEIELVEGQYNITVYSYKNSSINIGATVQEQCIEVPRGILGTIGITKKKCFDIQIPEQIISNVLAGGGSETHYILESELENSKTVMIYSQSLPIPSSLEQLESNYLTFEQRGLDIFIE